MVHALSQEFYIFFLLLAVVAAVIASQAMISGISAVIYQAINTKVFPRLKVEYTSSKLRSQIYITIVNWSLFVCVILMLLIFQHSSKLAAAYGLAVAGAMSITAVLMSIIFAYQKKRLHFAFAVFCAFVAVLFFSSCLLKIPHGGYYSLILALIPFVVILIYTSGQERLKLKREPQDIEHFKTLFETNYKNSKQIEGSAIFLARTPQNIPRYISDTMFNNGIMYEENILLSIKTISNAYGIEHMYEKICDGLSYFVITAGYMENVNVEQILRDEGIKVKSIFYGEQEIVPTNIVSWVFSLIKRVSPSFAQSYIYPSSSDTSFAA